VGLVTAHDPAWEADARRYVMAEAQRRLDAGEPLDGMVKFAYREVRSANGEVAQQGPYLLPSPALTPKEREASGEPFGRYYTLWDLSQGFFKL
jgi:hypothetical protein